MTSRLGMGKPITFFYSVRVKALRGLISRPIIDQAALGSGHCIFRVPRSSFRMRRSSVGCTVAQKGCSVAQKGAA